MLLVVPLKLRADIIMRYPDVLKPLGVTLEVIGGRMSKTKGLVSCILFMDFISLLHTFVNELAR